MDKKIFSDDSLFNHPAGTERFKVIWCGKGNGKWCAVLVDTFRDTKQVELFGKIIPYRILRRIEQATSVQENELKLLAEEMNWHFNLKHYLECF